jgi:hypothetical protein
MERPAATVASGHVRHALKDPFETFNALKGSFRA